MALTHAAYGNEPSTTTYYSCAAIIAIIPPWDERARAESADWSIHPSRQKDLHRRAVRTGNL